MPIPLIAYGVGAAVVFIGGLILDGCSGDEAGEPAGGEGPCDECHTAPSEKPVYSFNMYGRKTLDAHKFHLSPRVSNPLSCGNCHPTPKANGIWTTASHMNHEVDVLLGGFNKKSKDCTNECHGEIKLPWNVEYAEPKLNCTSCHAETTPKHDIDDIHECAKCHDETMNTDGTFKDLLKHLDLDGKKDVVQNTCVVCHDEPPDDYTHGNESAVVAAMVKGCANCHPLPTSPFRASNDDPHRNGEISFNVFTCGACHDFLPTKGAHLAHTSPSIAEPIACGECHIVPSIEDTEHMDPSIWPVVQFSGLAGTGEYDPVTKGCSAVYCHGSTLPEGQFVTIQWDDDTGTGGDCGDCHGIPPSSEVTIHDPSDTNCSACHPQFPDGHINGQVDLK